MMYLKGGFLLVVVVTCAQGLSEVAHKPANKEDREEGIIEEKDTANPCTSSPCENNGICIATGSGNDDFHCVCHPFFVGGKCQYDGLANVAKHTCGATCSASSEYYSCENAIDGNEIPFGWSPYFGEFQPWIEINFDSYYLVVSLHIRQRCHYVNQNRDLTIGFSDGTTQALSMYCHNEGFGDTDCSRVYWQNFDLQPSVTSNITITVNSACSSWRYNGFKEIEVYAYDVPLINIAKEDFGSTCTASSEYNNPDFACENAIDGMIDPTILGSEWASNGQGVGAWIQINFPDTYQIVSIGFLPRCDRDMQITVMEATFSDSPRELFSLTCDGGDHFVDCEGQTWQQFRLNNVATSSYVRLTIESICTAEKNHGFREVNVYGLLSNYVYPGEPGTGLPQPTSTVDYHKSTIYEDYFTETVSYWWRN